jgi:coiled-coil domain-containing protein 130
MAHFEISLKATQADGMYYPPEWRPEHGDLDTFQGGHKLGNQAKKISQVKLLE